MCHRHIPFVAILLATLFSVAADKEPKKAKEPAPSAAQIQLWVKQLGDEDFKVREEATHNLIIAGGAAFDAVTKATKSEDAEVKRLALKIVKHCENDAIDYFKKRVLDGKKLREPVLLLNCALSDVNDAGLVHLKWLTKLEELGLDGSAVTDSGLVHLKGLTNLKKLYLPRKVTDAGLVHLKGLTNLQALNLLNTKITDAGLVHLKGLANLQTLDLSNTKITDAGLVHLKGLSNLQTLDLSETKITDTGLFILKGLSNLRLLYVIDAKVTPNGMRGLQSLLPKCNIKDGTELPLPDKSIIIIEP